MSTVLILVNLDPQKYLDETDRRAVRSVIAHTYLQLLRILHVNNTKQWMFQDVDSAGCFVESDFTKKNRRTIGEKLVAPRVPTHKALAAMGKRQRFASREKDNVMKRMQKRPTQALTESHFYDWDLILYFDDSFGKVLRALSAAAQQTTGESPTAMLVHLTGAEWSTVLLLQDTIDAVQISVRSWLKKDQGWAWLSPEVRVDSGPWRTKEFVIAETEFEKMLGVEGSEIGRIEERTGCQIRYTDPRILRQKRLVSIIGPQSSLSSLPDEYHGVASFPAAFKK